MRVGSFVKGVAQVIGKAAPVVKFGLKNAAAIGGALGSIVPGIGTAAGTAAGAALSQGAKSLGII
jgi:hypothetical protein